MRKPFVLIAAAALGSGWIGSQAGANAIEFVPTGPTAIAVGQTTSFDVVVQIDPNVSGATFLVDVAGLEILSASNAMSGTNGFTSNFALRQDPSFVAWPGAVCVGDPDPVCTTARPGAPWAGNAGGLSGATFAAGTYTIGSYVVVGATEGTATVSAVIRPGFEWLDGGFVALPNPTSNVLQIAVPEPGRVLLLASGVAGLALLRRLRRRS